MKATEEVAVDIVVVDNKVNAPPADAQVKTPDPFVCKNSSLLPSVVGKVKV